MLSQTAIYALRAMGYIAKAGNDKPALAKTISAEMGIPLNFLSKIANRLTQAGLLKSARGVKGGFTLARPAETITLGEVAGLFMNMDDHKKCFLGMSECDGSCRLHAEWEPYFSKFNELLTNKTIDQLF